MNNELTPEILDNGQTLYPFVIYKQDMTVLGICWHFNGDRASFKAEAATGEEVCLWDKPQNVSSAVLRKALTLGNIT